jgi:hypothetical protein
MTNPVIHQFPVKRPGFITNCFWNGGDTSLSLVVNYNNAEGLPGVLEFATRNLAAGDVGELCLPASNNVADLGERTRDILVAHTRMACLLHGRAVPGSKEFTDSFLQSAANNLQTALGVVKVTGVGLINDESVNLTYKQGSGPNYTISVDHAELNHYDFAPSTQLLVIPGSVNKQFPTYVHDSLTRILTQAQKDAVVAYVLGLALWI